MYPPFHSYIATMHLTIQLPIDPPIHSSKHSHGCPSCIRICSHQRFIQLPTNHSTTYQSTHAHIYYPTNHPFIYLSTYLFMCPHTYCLNQSFHNSSTPTHSQPDAIHRSKHMSNHPLIFHGSIWPSSHIHILCIQKHALMVNFMYQVARP